MTSLGLGTFNYLQLGVHLHVDVLDVLELVPQRDDGVLLLVGVLLQELHGHLHLGAHAHLRIESDLTFETST